MERDAPWPPAFPVAPLPPPFPWTPGNHVPPPPLSPESPLIDVVQEEMYNSMTALAGTLSGRTQVCKKHDRAFGFLRQSKAPKVRDQFNRSQEQSCCP